MLALQLHCKNYLPGLMVNVDETIVDCEDKKIAICQQFCLPNTESFFAIGKVIKRYESIDKLLFFTFLNSMHAFHVIKFK